MLPGCRREMQGAGGRSGRRVVGGDTMRQRRPRRARSTSAAAARPARQFSAALPYVCNKQLQVCNKTEYKPTRKGSELNIYFYTRTSKDYYTII